MVDGKNTFIRITNQDIYNEIIELKQSNIKQHEEILIHQKQTNGKVKLNRWIATTALSLIIVIITTILRGYI